MHRIWSILLVVISSCGVHRTALIPPASPGDSTPLWVDLRPGMELRLDGAYYREGSPRRGLADYLGEEIVTYEVAPNGSLKRNSVSPLPPGKQQPRDQPAIQTFVGTTDLSRRFHRLFFQVVLSGTGRTRQAILLSARSDAEIERVTKQLSAELSPSCLCVTFPEWSTALAAITITVNGVTKKVIWGSALGSITTRPQHVEVLRTSNGRTAAVPIDLTDPQTLRLPLVNGDRITWN